MSILRTALYCRLSKDDMLQGDSESIKTQKAMLTQYAWQNALQLIFCERAWHGRYQRAATPIRKCCLC